MVIADGTRKLLGNLYEFEDLEPKDLKAFPRRYGLGRRYEAVRQKVASRHCIRTT